MERKPYPTDLTDAEFALVSSLLPAEKPENSRGRNPLYTNRELLDAILYHLRVGGAWRTLPHDLPHWNSVYAYFRRWSENVVLDRIVETLRARIRIQVGKEPTPSVAILDSQSVKTSEKGGPKSRRASAMTKTTKTMKRHAFMAVLLAVIFSAFAQCAGAQNDVSYVYTASFVANEPQATYSGNPSAVTVSGNTGCTATNNSAFFSRTASFRMNAEAILWDNGTIPPTIYIDQNHWTSRGSHTIAPGASVNLGADYASGATDVGVGTAYQAKGWSGVESTGLTSNDPWGHFVLCAEMNVTVGP